MKITYIFSNETIEIEVLDSWGELIVEMDRLEKNLNHKETRNLFYTDGYDFEFHEFAYEHDYLAAIIGEESIEERLPDAIAALEPQQQELLHKIFFEGRKKIDIAAEEGVSCAAISHRLEKIYKKIKLFLK